MGDSLQLDPTTRPAEPKAQREGDAGPGSSTSPSRCASGSGDHGLPAPTNLSGDPLAELLASNRELVEVNRQIATSLANLERLYADDLHRRQKIQRLTTAQFQRLKHPLSGWPFLLVLVLIPAVVFGMPVIMKWFGQ